MRIKYLENFLSENTVNNNNNNNDENKENDNINIINKERNNRLIKLVYFYKENRDINKMIQLLDALTKSSGFVRRKK